MTTRKRLVRAAGTAAVAVLVALGLPGVASAGTVGAGTVGAAAPAGVGLVPREGQPEACAFQTVNGHYLTAVGGGGRTTDVLHSDATQPSSWEFFTLVFARDNAPVVHFGLLTSNGHYLTAVDGGGRVSDVVHTNATQLLAWEKFTLIAFGNSVYALQTIDGHYLTAVGGGGRTTDVVHTNATVPNAWEKFTALCVGDEPL